MCGDDGKNVAWVSQPPAADAVGTEGHLALLWDGGSREPLII